MIKPDVFRTRSLRVLPIIFVFVVIAVFLVLAAGSTASEHRDRECSGRGTISLPAAKFYIEHNSTDQDTGVHGLFDGEDWTKLTVSDPSDKQVLEVAAKNQLFTQSISGIFFEAAEPPNDEVPIAEVLDRFPEGRYTVGGCSADGKRLRGFATLTHDIPAGPVINFPRDDDTAPASGFAVSWNHVDETIFGEAINRTGYEVIITKDVPDDPNGFSRPTFDVHVPPNVTSLTVPAEFLERRTRYELEVLVLEVSGNQTITNLFFETE